jgi:hypothetical protein
LYAGGVLTAGGGPANVARWDGATWSSIGGQIGGVHSLAVHDDGGGPALYESGAEPPYSVARWDGTSWNPIASSVLGVVQELAVFDDGSGGPALYAAGNFVQLDGTPLNRFARWDGTSWLPLGSGTNGGYVYALEEYDDGSGLGPTLCLGGGFSFAEGSGDSFVARWGGCSGPGRTFCAGDASCPCNNPGQPGHGCDNSQGTGGVALELASFSPDLAGGGTADFIGTGYPTNGTPGVALIRSRGAQALATVFGDGLLCVSPTGLVRISATVASGGASLNPVMHGAGAGTFYYQLVMRSTPVTFCDPVGAFNLSNGVEVTWP